MKALFCIALALLAIQSQAASVPSFSPTIVDTYRAADRLAPGMAHIRVDLSIDSDRHEDGVKIGGVTLCTKSACFRAATIGLANLSNTSEGNSTLVADALVPDGKYTDIYLDEAAGQKVFSGSAHFSSSLDIDEGMQGGDVLLVATKPRATDSVQRLSIASVATGFYRDDQQTIYYNPSFATEAVLRLSTKLTIPAGATAAPEVFVVSVNDVGERYPLVDIFPYIPLAHEASIESALIPEKPPVDGFPPRLAPEGMPTKTALDPIVRMNINRTGVVHLAWGMVGETDTPSRFSATSCADVLSSPSNKANINQAMITWGFEYLDWCTQIPPYVHIAIVNMSDAHEHFSIPYALSAPDGNGLQYLSLLPITSWAPGSQLVINGFTWSGDKGSSDGQVGNANGYLNSGGRILGNNRQGGGVNGGNGLSDGNKLVLGNNGSNAGFAWYELSAVGASYQNYTFNVVSSSTSVIKYSSCTTDSTSSAWSAAGVTNNYMASGQARFVAVSSATGTNTTAAALCPIFQALGIADAIRLDGGPSTSMVVNGQVMNPLNGLYKLYYGSERHIAYGLRFVRN